MNEPAWGQVGLVFLDHLKAKPRKKKMMNKLLALSVVVMLFGCSNQKDAEVMQAFQDNVNTLETVNKKLMAAAKTYEQEAGDFAKALEEENRKLKEENGKLKTDIIKFATDLKPRLIEFTTENKRLQSEVTKLKEENRKLKEGSEGLQGSGKDDGPSGSFDGSQPKGGGPDVENPNRPKKKE